jgi:hypothetical protein
VAERRLVVYVPRKPSGPQPQASPPLRLLWTVVPGDQVPLFSKGEFEAAVKKFGGRLLTNDDSDADVTLYKLVLAGGEEITHLARKKGPYTLLTGDYSASGNFVASLAGASVLVVDSGAMVNLLGATHSASLANRRAPDPSLILYAAGNHLLHPILQGGMQLILTHNNEPTKPLPAKLFVPSGG